MRSPFSKKRLNGLAYRNRELLSLAAEIKQTKCYNRYVDRFRLEGDRTKGALLYLDYDGRYDFNYLLYHKLLRQERYYKELETAINQYGDSAFPRIVHGWLGQPDSYDDRNWIGEDAIKMAREELNRILQKYNGVALNTEDEQQEFGYRLESCYTVLCEKSKRTDRNERGQLGRVQLNHILGELQTTGKIEKSGKKGSETWILKVNNAKLEVVDQ